MLGWFGAVLPTHPGRVGRKQNLTCAAAGWGLQGGLEGRGNWGRGVNMLLAQKSRASGSKSAQAARLLCCAQKVLARFTDLQAMCAGGCRGEPPALPRPNPPQTSSLHSEVRGPRVWFSDLWVQTPSRGPGRALPRQEAPTLAGQEGRAFVELLRCRVAGC